MSAFLYKLLVEKKPPYLDRHGFFPGTLHIKGTLLVSLDKNRDADVWFFVCLFFFDKKDQVLESNKHKLTFLNT